MTPLIYHGRHILTTSNFHNVRFNRAILNYLTNGTGLPLVIFVAFNCTQTTHVIYHIVKAIPCSILFHEYFITHVDVKPESPNKIHKYINHWVYASAIKRYPNVQTLSLRQFSMHVYHLVSEHQCSPPNCESQELWIQEEITRSFQRQLAQK